MKRVIIVDTSFLCCYLSVVGKETCGEGNLRFDPKRAKEKVEEILKDDVTLVLPLASIIETGNHIANSSQYRYERAKSFVVLLQSAANGTSPWANIEDQKHLWANDSLNEIIEDWPRAAAAKASIGDHTIRLVADYYSRAGLSVEILTGDRDLHSYVPKQPTRKPRRYT